MDTLQYVYSSSESDDDDLETASTTILPKESLSSSSSQKKLPNAESLRSGRLSRSPEDRRHSLDKKAYSPEPKRGKTPESRKDSRSSDRRSSDRRSPSSYSRSSGPRDKRRSRDKDRDRDWEKDRDRDRERRYRKRSRSRSRSRTRRRDRSKERRYDWRSKSRSPRRSRRDSPKRRSNDSSRSRSPPPRKHFDPKNKLYILTKMGIDYKGTESIDAPNRGGGGHVSGNVSSDGAGVPTYYNPLTINAGKYADQIAKRKLLWNNKKAEKVESSATSSSIWQGAKFSQDSDGKMTAKFQRLMGMKEGDSSGATVSTKGQDLIKKQEELFSTMEMQYEVARATTHTQRGVGLGFGPRHIP